MRILAAALLALGTGRSRDGEELAYVRARFLVDCRAAGVEAIDAPWTFTDAKGVAADAKWARKMGYRMKSLVAPAPAKARRIVVAFEKARAAGLERAKVDVKLVEVPIYSAAKRLLSSVARTPPPRRRK